MTTTTWATPVIEELSIALGTELFGDDGLVNNPNIPDATLS